MPHYVADIERTVPRLQRHGWRIVYLQRRDAFTGALSRFVAAAGKHWITRSDHVALTAPPVRIESAELLAEIRGRIELDQREQRSVAGRPHLKLIYEDDLADAACWTATTERVFAYLGLPALPVQHAINKTWDRPYQEIVANYDELAAAVRSSELAYVLSLVAAAQRQAQQDLGEE